MQDHIFHRRDGPEYAGSRLAQQLVNGRLSNTEITLIKDFLYERKAKKNLSGGRVALYVNHLIRVRDFLPGPFNEMTTGAFMEAISKIKTGYRLDGKKLSSSTIHDYILSLKVFSEWLSRKKIVDVPIEEIKDIKVPKAPLMTKTPDDMLTEEDIEKLIGVCDNSKERALVACVFDAALRIEEAGYLRWRQIQKLKYGISISTDKKTGFPRYIPCPAAWTYLKTWKMDYPAMYGIPPEGDNYVFLTQKAEPYQYSGFQYLMKKFSRKLKLQGDKALAKKLHFHLLRHSKLTHYAKQNMNESILCKIGWGKRSSMVERYINLSQVDVEMAVMGIAGIKDMEMPKPIFVPGVCPHCLCKEVPPTATYCPDCGSELTEEALTETEALVRSVRENPLSLRKVVEAMIEEKMGKAVAK